MYMTLAASKNPIKTDLLFTIVLVLTMSAAVAYAGSDNTFAVASTWLANVLQGSLGKVFALASLAVGLGVGIIKQSVMAVAVGAGMALVCSIGPGIIIGMFSAAM